MTIEYFDTLSEKSNEWLTSTQKLNRLNADNMEKLAELQIASVQAYSSLGIAQAKAVASINDATTLKAYLDGQTKFAKNVGEQLVSDLKGVAELGKAYSVDIKTITDESLKVAGLKAA